MNSLLFRWVSHDRAQEGGCQNADKNRWISKLRPVVKSPFSNISFGFLVSKELCSGHICRKYLQGSKGTSRQLVEGQLRGSLSLSDAAYVVNASPIVSKKSICAVLIAWSWIR